MDIKNLYVTITQTPAGITYFVETPAQHRAATHRARRRAILQEHLGTALAGIGFLLMLGSMSTADCDTAPPAWCFAWSLAGLAVMAAGAYAARAFYGQEDAAQWNK